MTTIEERVVMVEIPASVTLTVSDAPEGIKGDSANNVQKTITLETGISIQAPLFIKTGEKIGGYPHRPSGTCLIGLSLRKTRKSESFLNSRNSQFEARG